MINTSSSAFIMLPLTLVTVVGYPNEYSNNGVLNDTIKEIAEDVIANNKTLRKSVMQHYDNLKRNVKLETESLMTHVESTANNITDELNPTITQTCIFHNINDAKLVVDFVTSEILTCALDNIAVLDENRQRLANVADTAEKIINNTKIDDESETKFKQDSWEAVRDFSLKLSILSSEFDQCFTKHMSNAKFAISDIIDFIKKKCASFR